MAPASVVWHGVQVAALNGDALCWAPLELVKASRFVLVGAEGLEHLPASAVTVPLVAAGFDASAHLMPHLIDVRSQTMAVQSDILEALAEGAFEREVPYCALLETQAEVSLLQRHLCHQQQIARKGEVAWLRLHDPYVAVHLPRALGASGMRRIMGPVDRWHLRLGGQWLTLNRPQPGAGESAAETEPGAHESWYRLNRIGAVNRALALCDQLHLDGIRAHAQHLDALVTRAKEELHLDNPQEQARYAQMGLYLDLRFDEHPMLAQSLAGPDEVPAARARRLAALPAEVWNRLTRECPRRDAPSRTDSEPTS